jgi:hypothetical protein
MGTKLETWKKHLERLENSLEKTKANIPVPEKNKKCMQVVDYMTFYGEVTVRQDVFQELIDKLKDFATSTDMPNEVHAWQLKHHNFVEKEIKHLLLYFRRFKYTNEENKMVKDQISSILKRSNAFLKNDKDIQRRIEHYFKNTGGLDFFELLQDKQFLITCGIKIACIPISILSSYLAGVLFRKKYECHFPTYVPSLWWFMVYYIGIFIGLTTLLFIAPSLISVKKPEWWSRSMNSAAFMDVLTCSFLHITIMSLLTFFFQIKKYFRFQVSGINTSNSLSHLTYMISIIIYLLPFFFMYW